MPSAIEYSRTGTDRQRRLHTLHPGDIQVATRSFPEVSLESVLKKTKIDAASAEIRVYPTIKSYDDP